MEKTIAIIPARFGSSRFPGKPLAQIGKKTMIRRVYERCSSCASLDEVWVATDDERIRQEVESFNGKVVLTSDRHKSGTDRCAEAMEKIGFTEGVVINVQGDEPFVHTSQLEQVISLFQDPETDIATLKIRIEETTQLHSSDAVKVVCDRKGKALYFSRQAIPFRRDTDREDWLKTGLYYKHIGMYGFRAPVLKKVAQLAPGVLEEAEKLEQLRWMENGLSIVVAETPFDSLSVDSPEDIERIMNRIKTGV